MERIAYETDVSDREWEFLEKLMPPTCDVGRPREVPWREIVNAIFYVTKTGCHWRLLPHDFPKWWTVYFYFRAWRIMGIWEAINDELVKTVRMAQGRNEEPSAGIIDSQSVKNAETAGNKGYDGAKKISGVKRHIVVDTTGLLLKVEVHRADIQDREGAVKLLKKVHKKYPTIVHGWADGGYSGKLIAWAQKKLGINLEIVKRSDDMTGFKVLPRRWVVERTFGWLGRNRRLSKNYERKTKSAESYAYLGMTRIMLRRLGSSP